MKKTLRFLCLNAFFLSLIFQTQAQNNPFITTWRVDKPDLTITIPTNSSYVYDYSVDWGDGTTGTGLVGDSTHTYSKPGDYDVSISGDFPAIYFNSNSDASKIIDIVQWGDIQWETMNSGFSGCLNLTMSASDTPDLTNVTSMNGMFRDCGSFNSNLNNWDVSQVQQFGSMFENAQAFNGIIKDWDTSNALIMGNMFRDAVTFNKDISKWDISNVILISNMFQGAISFNQKINGWDVSNAVGISQMFMDATAFNQDISGWDVSNVRNIDEMFKNATAFNQDISGWNVSNVQTMDGMLSNASSFNFDLGSWDLQNVSSLKNMLSNTALSVSNYDATLTGWANGNNTPSYIFLGATGLEYCTSSADRSKLINTFNWTITGDSKAKFCFGMKAAESTSVEEKVSMSGYKLSLYPNPTTSHLNVQVDRKFESNVVLQIIDLLGKVQHQRVLEGTEARSAIELNTSDLNTGTYFLKIESDHGTYKERFIKR